MRVSVGRGYRASHDRRDDASRGQAAVPNSDGIRLGRHQITIALLSLIGVDSEPPLHPST
jgi:hypothetical protein